MFSVIFIAVYYYITLQKTFPSFKTKEKNYFDKKKEFPFQEKGTQMSPKAHSSPISSDTEEKTERKSAKNGSKNKQSSNKRSKSRSERQSKSNEDDVRSQSRSQRHSKSNEEEISAKKKRSRSKSRQRREERRENLQRKYKMGEVGGSDEVEIDLSTLE